jgi:hypothetical protein
MEGAEASITQCMLATFTAIIIKATIWMSNYPIPKAQEGLAVPLVEIKGSAGHLQISHRFCHPMPPLYNE